MVATASASSAGVLSLAVFLACAVEMVEAWTIVIAVGATEGWKVARRGAFAALAVLGVLVAVVGPPLVHFVPLSALRLVIGGLLLNFGLQWLRKAVLRASGHKAKHDEDAIYAEQVAELEALSPDQRARAGFVVAFKGVFLEGLEVVIIVLTLGSTSHRLGLAALAAVAAVVVVTIVGLVVARQLSSVPENAMKMSVALMLASFGTFWAGEGVGVDWPGSDLAIVALVAAYGVATWVLVLVLRRRTTASPAVAPRVSEALSSAEPATDLTSLESSTQSSMEAAGVASGWFVRGMRGFGQFWWDFLIGDTPELFIGVVAALACTALLCHGAGATSVMAVGLPLLVVGLTWVSVGRVVRLVGLAAESSIR